MRFNYSRIFLYTLFALPIFAIGVVFGFNWNVNSSLIFTEGIPIECKLTELGINSYETHLGYYAKFEFTIDDVIRQERQTISKEAYDSLNEGDYFLGFYQSNEPSQIYVLFDIPVINTSGTTLTIALK